MISDTPKAPSITEMLRTIARWDHRGDSLMEAWDELHGAGAYAAIVKAAAILESLASADEGVLSVKRYDADEYGMDENPSGDFVLYKDHLAALSAQSTAADEMAVALQRLIACYSVSHSPDQRQACWDQARAALAAHEAKHGGKG